MGENRSWEQKSSVMGVWIRNKVTGRYEILPKEKVLAERRGWWGWGGNKGDRDVGTEDERGETREKNDGKLTHWQAW